jgi:hypothetical protein
LCWDSSAVDFPQMRRLTMKPIFSLMGIACAQAA